MNPEHGESDEPLCVFVKADGRACNLTRTHFAHLGRSSRYRDRPTGTHDFAVRCSAPGCRESTATDYCLSHWHLRRPKSTGCSKTLLIAALMFDAEAASDPKPDLVRLLSMSAVDLLMMWRLREARVYRHIVDSSKEDQELLRQLASASFRSKPR
jgi:hypothetical protein